VSAIGVDGGGAGMCPAHAAAATVETASTKINRDSAVMPPFKGLHVTRCPGPVRCSSCGGFP
jgi:hypothetical protein